MAEIILEVKDLKKVFMRHKKVFFAAVDDVSFTLDKGECLGIVGESGSGKSTVAKMITRLVDTTGGSITFLEKDITHIKGRELQKVYQKMQMIFQLPVESFDKRCTLGDSVAEGLRNFGMSKKDAKKKVEELLVKCDLDESFAARFPHEVSGGQCQRAAIARALALDPSLLICDEATSALDVTVQKQVLELLKKLKKEENLSFLFICHDLALVQEFCDRVIVMYKGEIVESGATDEIINNPQKDYTRKLIDSVL